MKHDMHKKFNTHKYFSQNEILLSLSLFLLFSTGFAIVQLNCFVSSLHFISYYFVLVSSSLVLFFHFQTPMFCHLFSKKLVGKIKNILQYQLFFKIGVCYLQLYNPCSTFVACSYVLYHVSFSSFQFAIFLMYLVIVICISH